MTEAHAALNRSGVVGTLTRLMAEGMAPKPLPARQLELPLEPLEHPREPRGRTLRRDPRLLERLDRWFWRQQQREREAYLAKAQDLADLEARIKALERGGNALGF